MTKAYLNALAEEGTRQDLIDWLCKLDAENDKLRDGIRELKGERRELLQEASGNHFHK